MPAPKAGGFDILGLSPEPVKVSEGFAQPIILIFMAVLGLIITNK